MVFKCPLCQKRHKLRCQQTRVERCFEILKGHCVYFESNKPVKKSTVKSSTIRVLYSNNVGSKYHNAFILHYNHGFITKWAYWEHGQGVSV